MHRKGSSSVPVHFASIVLHRLLAFARVAFANYPDEQIRVGLSFCRHPLSLSLESPHYEPGIHYSCKNPFFKQKSTTKTTRNALTLQSMNTSISVHSQHSPFIHA